MPIDKDAHSALVVVRCPVGGGLLQYSTVSDDPDRSVCPLSL